MSTLTTAQGRVTAPLPAWASAGRQALLLALWFGVLGGLIQLVGLAVQKFVLGDVIRAGPHVMWMAPVAEFIVATTVVVPLLLIALRWRAAAGIGVVTGVLAFLGLLSILVLPGWLHWIAATVLAAGLAVQVARLTRRFPGGFMRVVRRTVPVLVLVVVLLGVGLHAWLFLRERAAIAALPAAPAGRPNVILIILDTVRARSLGLYGHFRPTSPRLERLAAGGITFQKAISPSSWTLPAHASMFTGRHHHELELGWVQPLNSDYPTLAEYLAGHGYTTGGFVANVLYADAEDGLARGFIHYEDYLKSPGQVLWSSALVRRLLTPFGPVRRILGKHELLGRKDAREVNASFLRWVDDVDGRPFFAFLNYFDAHHPYLPEPEFAARIGAAPERSSLVERIRDLRERDKLWDISAEELEEEVLRYEAAVAEVDDAIGDLVDSLSRRKLLGNTILIVTSDHGEEFGEHGEFTHGINLYMETVHVPLVVHYPAAVPAGNRVEEPVSLRDIPATVVDLVNLENGSPFPGSTMARYWTGGPAQPSGPVLSAVNPTLTLSNLMQLQVIGSMHHILNQDGSKELYDLRRDPDERYNLLMQRSATDTAAPLPRRPRTERTATEAYRRPRPTRG